MTHALVMSVGTELRIAVAHGVLPVIGLKTIIYCGCTLQWYHRRILEEKGAPH